MGRRVLILALAFAGAGVASAGEHHFGETLMREWGFDVDSTPVTSEQMAPGVHALFGVGGGGTRLTVTRQSSSTVGLTA